MSQLDRNKAVDGATNGCPTGKRAYVTRRQAHQAAVRLRKRGVHVRAFACVRGCGQFHTGHLAAPVLGGWSSAADWYGRANHA